MRDDISRNIAACDSIYLAGRKYDKIIYSDGEGSDYSETSVYLY